MARLNRTSFALLETRLQISAALNAAPLVDTQTIGKAPAVRTQGFEHHDPQLYLGPSTVVVTVNMLFDCCRAQAENVPMDLSMFGQDKTGKGDKKAKALTTKAKADTARTMRQGTKSKGEDNAKATAYFAGYCLGYKAWGHMKDCWWNELPKSWKHTSSPETLSTVNPTVRSLECCHNPTKAAHRSTQRNEWVFSLTNRESNK